MACGERGARFDRWAANALPAALLLAFIAAAPSTGAAQVLEIDASGLVTTYDRPSTFGVEGAKAIDRGMTARASRTSGRPVARDAVVHAAGSSGLSAELLESVGLQESGLRAGVVSRAGAIGEMQLMPQTARSLGVNPYDTKENVLGGARYLSGLMQRYDGNLVLALAAYNAGPGAVDRYRGVPPFAETRAYVAAILDRLSLRALGTEK